MGVLDDVALKCSNVKCFADDFQGFDRIKPINVIIGRNNTGKSTLLDLVAHATDPASFSVQRHQRNAPEVRLLWQLSKPFLMSKLKSDQVKATDSQNNETWFNPNKWAMANLRDKYISYELKRDNTLHRPMVEGYEPENEMATQKSLAIARLVDSNFKNHFAGFVFQRLLADRDVVPEISDNSLNIAPNGAGATNAIQQYINSAKLDRSLVEGQLLDDLNEIFGSDAKFKRILVQEDAGRWELYLEEDRKGRIPMSHTGSGLKTVILVLTNLLLMPRIRKEGKPVKTVSDFLFGFEELENNLHPALQRRLFRYLRQKAITEHCHFFLTTHSNVVIDLFSNDEHAQILHVTHDGTSATVNSVATFAHGHNVLDDLDVRASDLLQTNVVVWVEGPSDRIYFRRWVDLWSAGQLCEGIHYQCVPIGGNINAHYSFATPEEVEDLIAALKINRNAIILADSDRRAESEDLKETTDRLATEVSSGGGYSWTTKGRQVENYIPLVTFQALLGNSEITGPGIYEDALTYVAIQREHKTPPVKTVLANQIAPLLTREAIQETLDMAGHLDNVCEYIRKWNRIESPATAAS